jgi:hypothetical protein
MVAGFMSLKGDISMKTSQKDRHKGNKERKPIKKIFRELRWKTCPPIG